MASDPRERFLCAYAPSHSVTPLSLTWGGAMSGPYRIRRAASLSAVAASALVTAVLGPVSNANAATWTGPVISVDPFNQGSCHGSTATNHQANVEPDTFANGSTIVAAFQVGRIYDGGACAIGFSTSTDSGATWNDGLLP